MNDYEQRIKVLEEKVKILEETLETLKNMQMSEQMQGFIQAKTRTLKMVELINSVSEKPELDMSKEQNAIMEIEAKKRSVDKEIANVIKSSNDFSEKSATDVKYFEYEIENGIDDYDRPIQELSEYIGKGIRITAYNGFDCDSIIIPSEINGLPVTSVGEKAFINAKFSEILLPDSIVAILKSAFMGCENLIHISFPDSIKIIGNSCCCDCKKLESVVIGENTEMIGFHAFYSTSLKKIVIPPNVRTVSEDAFGDSSIFDRVYSNREPELDCVFLGKQTSIEKNVYMDGDLGNVKMIYCLPGSAIQRYAREHSIPMKPLSEFKTEE